MPVANWSPRKQLEPGEPQDIEMIMGEYDGGIFKLVKFPIGRHFDKAGERVHPPRPKFTDRHWEMSP